MASIYSWSTTASDNASADVDINWREGQLPSTVNNSARQMMGRLAEWVGDVSGSLTAGGTANALTVTANSGFTSYADGLVVTFRASDSNSGAATLSVNSIGAKNIRKISPSGDVALEAGDIQEDCLHVVMYNSSLDGGSGAWQLMDRPERALPPPRTDYVPTGAIMPFCGTLAPTDYLLCFGQNVSRTTYADLFAVIGTIYGEGDGSTTFTIPDLRGRVIAGKDNMGGDSANRLTNQSGGVNGIVLGGSGGDETHTLTVAQMPSHNHTASVSTNGQHAHNYTLRTGVANAQGGSGAVAGGSGSTTEETNQTGNHSHTVTIGDRGGGGAHNNVQPTFILNYIIRT